MSFFTACDVTIFGGKESLPYFLKSTRCLFKFKAIYLFIYLCIYLYIYLSTYLFIYLFIYLLTLFQVDTVKNN